MTLSRILEVEIMDTDEEAREYDAMDHSTVNRRFVDDLLTVGPLPDDLLDVGTGTARIPIELCRRAADCRVMALDAAVRMLDVARYNLEIAGLTDRIQLVCGDAKQLPFPAGLFGGVISNSIVHHLPEPLTALREALRVVQPGGLLFFRDLLRPPDQATLEQLVQQYAGGESATAQGLFAASLHAALTLDEIRQLVTSLGCPASTVQPTSDRHWTWSCRRP